MHQIRYIKTSELNLLEGNPRQITKERFEKLKESIAKNPAYFEARPCLVSDRTGKLVVYAGNQRLRAGRAIGLAQVPCIVETLTAEEEKERTIRDNLEFGEWNIDELANNWNTVELQNWGLTDFDMGIAPNEAKAKEPKICPKCGEEI